MFFEEKGILVFGLYCARIPAVNKFVSKSALIAHSAKTDDRLYHDKAKV